MQYHVIAVDAAKVSRIVHSDRSPVACQLAADAYWDEQADEGEMVFVGSDNCQTVKLIKEKNNN